MPDDLSQFERASAEFRQQLLSRDRDAARAMTEAYGAAWVRIKARVDTLNAQIQDARAAGEEVNQSWLFQRARLQTLQVQVEQEIADFARYAGQQITSAQSDVVGMAADHAAGLVQTQFPPEANVTMTWARLPRSAVEDLVGNTSDGSPLSDLLNELPGEAGTAVKKALIVGVATGLNPRTVARQIRQELGGNLVRALTISRTEILRSYRTASLRSYQANSDIMEGWVWSSARDRRTCAFCWAMTGTVHKLDEPFASHPRCRCSPSPRTVSWETLLGEKVKGIPDTRPVIEKGTDLFEKLPDERKRDILGPAKFAAYQDGKLKLADVAGFRKDPKWGPVGFERSLKDIMGEKGAAQYLDPVRRDAALKAAAARATAAGGSGKGGKPTVTGGGVGDPGDSERRRQLRLAQLEKGDL
ncbi:MAG: phage minor head protein [Dehalococcoidales bacterium]|nr:phage minor head protein [Dehalococcoidales bacterium]